MAPPAELTALGEVAGQALVLLELTAVAGHPALAAAGSCRRRPSSRPRSSGGFTPGLVEEVLAVVQQGAVRGGRHRVELVEVRGRVDRRLQEARWWGTCRRAVPRSSRWRRTRRPHDVDTHHGVLAGLRLAALESWRRAARRRSRTTPERDLLVRVGRRSTRRSEPRSSGGVLALGVDDRAELVPVRRPRRPSRMPPAKRPEPRSRRRSPGALRRRAPRPARAAWCVVVSSILTSLGDGPSTGPGRTLTTWVTEATVTRRTCYQPLT